MAANAWSMVGWFDGRDWSSESESSLVQSSGASKSEINSSSESEGARFGMSESVDMSESESREGGEVRHV